MPAPVFKIDRLNLDKEVRNLDVSANEMYDVGRIARKNLIDRVRNEGKNKEGRSMGRYSPDYGDWRAKQGKRTDIIDLTDTGIMLNSIAPQARVNVCDLIVEDHKEAAAHTDRRFNWFGITPANMRKLTQVINRILRRKL